MRSRTSVTSWLPISSTNAQRKHLNSLWIAIRKATPPSASSITCSAKWDSSRELKRMIFQRKTCGQKFRSPQLRSCLVTRKNRLLEYLPSLRLPPANPRSTKRRKSSSPNRLPMWIFSPATASPRKPLACSRPSCDAHLATHLRSRNYSTLSLARATTGAPPNSQQSWNRSTAKQATAAVLNDSENCAAASSVPLVCRMRNWQLPFPPQKLPPRLLPHQRRWVVRFPKSRPNLLRRPPCLLLSPLRRLPWRRRSPSRSRPSPSSQKFRKLICPMSGRPFWTHRVLPRELRLLRLCLASLLPEAGVPRSPGTWKSFRLSRNPQLVRSTMRYPHLLPFRSSQNQSLGRHRGSLHRASLNKSHRLRPRRNLLRQASLNSNWNRNMSSCWKRSRSSRRTTSGRPRNLLPRRSRSRKMRRHRHLQAVALPLINFWPILPTRSTSSASASFPQDFRGRCQAPSRRPLRSQRRRPHRLPNPVHSRKFLTNFAPSWVRWARRTKTSKPTTTWASRFGKWGFSRRPSANSRKSPRPAIAAAPSAIPCSVARFWAWPSWIRASRPLRRSGMSVR